MSQVIINVNAKGETSLKVNGKMSAPEMMAATLSSVMIYLYENTPISASKMHYMVSHTVLSITSILMEQENQIMEEMEDELEDETSKITDEDVSDSVNSIIQKYITKDGKIAQTNSTNLEDLNTQK